DLPILDRCLVVAANCDPSCAVEDVQVRLVAAGLAAPGFQLDGLVRASELFGRLVPSTVQTICRRTLVMRSQEHDLAQRVMTVACRTIRRYGAARTADVAAKVAAIGERPASEDRVREVVMSRPDFRWLEQADGWFWLHSVRRNSLRHYVEKVMS